MGGKKELVTGYSRGQTIERVPRTSSATQSCPIEKPVCMQLQLKIAYFTANSLVKDTQRAVGLCGSLLSIWHSDSWVRNLTHEASHPAANSLTLTVTCNLHTYCESYILCSCSTRLHGRGSANAIFLLFEWHCVLSSQNCQKSAGGY